MSPLVFVTAKTELEALAEAWVDQSPCFPAIFNDPFSESSNWTVNLKPKQVNCLEAVYFGENVVAVLPTGYGKSIIFYLLPALLSGKFFPFYSELRKDLPARPSGCFFVISHFLGDTCQLEPGSFFPRTLWGGEMKDTGKGVGLI